jgi:hypothetical protein
MQIIGRISAAQHADLRFYGILPSLSKPVFVVMDYITITVQSIRVNRTQNILFPLVVFREWIEGADCWLLGAFTGSKLWRDIAVVLKQPLFPNQGGF